MRTKIRNSKGNPRTKTLTPSEIKKLQKRKAGKEKESSRTYARLGIQMTLEQMDGGRELQAVLDTVEQVVDIASLVKRGKTERNDKSTDAKKRGGKSREKGREKLKKETEKQRDKQKAAAKEEGRRKCESRDGRIKDGREQRERGNAKGRRRKENTRSKKSQGVGSLEEKKGQAVIAKRMIDYAKNQLSLDKSDNIVRAVVDIVIAKLQIEIMKMLKRSAIHLLTLAFPIVLTSIVAGVLFQAIFASPFAILFPNAADKKKNQVSVQEKIWELQENFKMEMNEKDGIVQYDTIEGEIPDNFYDILAVYSIKYNRGQYALTMDSKNERNLKKVFDDMCSWEEIVDDEESVEDSENAVGNNEEGDLPENNPATEEKSITILVHLLNYQEMIAADYFTKEEEKWLRELMIPENLRVIKQAIEGTNQEIRVDNEDYAKSYGLSFEGIVFTGGQTEVIYYNQLDKRWADKPYGKTGSIGTSGCGPTSMSIVVSTLTGESVDPIHMAQWAYKNGYRCEGNGSYHSLIPAAAKNWSLSVKDNLTAQEIVEELSAGNLIVALMAEGHFTQGGHFIVLRGVTESGKILVADPASTSRSNQEWDFSIIMNEARKGASAGGPFWSIGVE